MYNWDGGKTQHVFSPKTNYFLIVDIFFAFKTKSVILFH